MADSFKNQFLLDPEVVFLNHGSFGACPKPVFDVYQFWQRELERQPVEFLGRRIITLLAESRQKLAKYLGCSADDVVYFPNPTTAINMVARNIRLQPGDEILTTNYEYGAMDRTWEYLCSRAGAQYVHHPIPLPVTTHEEFIERFWEGVSPKTKAIFISHITSPTALTFPIQEICRRAQEAGILTMIDGAHAPGQIALNLEEIGAAIYVGACHKWMMSPKGASFLYATPSTQAWLDPLVISWGYNSDPGFGSGNRFIDYHEWQGTRDMSAFLAVPAAIQFMEENHWDQVQEDCHQLAIKTRQKIQEITGLQPVAPETEGWFHQMFTAFLPDMDLKEAKDFLYNEYRIEVPLHHWNHQPLIRVSVQAYNTDAELNILVNAVEALCSKM